MINRKDFVIESGLEDVRKEFICKKSLEEIVCLKNEAITYIILCKNEIDYIENCIQSILQELEENDEILVLDSGSDDGTLEVLEGYGEKLEIIKTVWNNDFSELRNIGISEAHNQWIFFIDADERLVNGSARVIKEYINVFVYLNITDVIFAPGISNLPHNVSNESYRIFKRDSGIQYYGLVHEEPRKELCVYGNDIVKIRMKQIILLHEGYTEECIKRKNKLDRNRALLEKMIMIEPLNPRWKYFFCRDCREILSEESYLQIIEEVIFLCGDNDTFQRYKIRAISDLIMYYVVSRKFEDSKKWIKSLQNIAPDLSDVIYFEELVLLMQYRNFISKELGKLISYRETHSEVEFRSIHSYYYHIDFLIAQMLFDLGEYDKAIKLFATLHSNKYVDKYKILKNLYECLKKEFE